MRKTILTGVSSMFVLLAPLLAKADTMMPGQTTNGQVGYYSDCPLHHMGGGAFYGSGFQWVTMFLLWILLVSVIFAIWHWMGLKRKK